jgi:nickel-dependent lactate racemase
MKETVVELPYGQKSLELKLPKDKGIRVLTPRNRRAIADPQRHVENAISRFFDRNTDFSRYGDKKVCIVVSDNTRCTFNHIIIPILLNELSNSGIRRENITILVANGLHRPMSYGDLIENLGQSIVNDFKVENHDPDGELVSLGQTKRGTPLLINKHFMEADLKIATGLVAPHFHAGFGGGCKSVLPGISGRATILKNHSCDMLAHKNARYGTLLGNPVYEDIMEAGLRTGLNLIVNVAVNPEMKLTRLFIGEPETTHRKAAQKVSADIKVEFDGLYDVVVTTNGGYPLDRNLYQCVKGVAIGELMVKEGGTIVLASECRDGVGHRVFQKYMAYGKDSEAVLGKLKIDEPVEDQDNIQILARALARAKVVIVSEGVDPQTVKDMKMQHSPSVEEALRSCGWPENKKLRIAVIPGGPYVLPVGV